MPKALSKANRVRKGVRSDARILEVLHRRTVGRPSCGQILSMWKTRRTKQVSGRISLGSAADVDVAVNAARRAFASWSQSSARTAPGSIAVHPRRIPEACRRSRRGGHRGNRAPPSSLAAGPQVFLGIGHLTTAIDVLKNFSFEEHKGGEPDRQGTHRRLRIDHALELADQPGRSQGLPGVGDRLHRHPQTL